MLRRPSGLGTGRSTFEIMKARILIAEDDPNIRLGLVATLESDGYGVTAAADGAQALRLYPQQKFDLVLLDIMMPRQSGVRCVSGAARAGRSGADPVPHRQGRGDRQGRRAEAGVRMTT
jgi:CheY-like chemotaxis protein